MGESKSYLTWKKGPKIFNLFSNQDAKWNKKMDSIIFVITCGVIGTQCLKDSELKDHSMNEVINKLITKVFAELPRLHHVC